MEQTRWLSVDEQRTWRSLLQTTQVLFDLLDREMQADAGFSHAYYEILVHLSEAPGRTLRMSELAARSVSSRSRLSHAVDRLEERGWVVRRSVPSDRRGALAVLTDEGFAALETAAPAHVEGVRRHLFDQLGAEQVEQFAGILSALQCHLAQHGAAPLPGTWGGELAKTALRGSGAPVTAPGTAGTA